MNLPNNGYHAENKGLKMVVQLTETDIVKNIIRMLKQVAQDERIDKNIRDEYLADLSEQIEEFMEAYYNDLEIDYETLFKALTKWA